MKTAAMSIAFAAIVALGPQAFASDPPSSSTTASSDAMNNGAPKNETMKECMARQKASNASSMSATAMHTVCKNEMKVNKERSQGQDLATGTQAKPKS